MGNHPLVYYAIRNAQASEFITDVIVTTDSSEVAMIASQMGAQVRWRDQRLCGDAVTLDAVVDDAVDRSVSWNYVITMQPTSPTLTSKTLDKAIRYAINHDYDTVISAINAPHLSWSVENGKIVPNYRERLNRQYLPAHYKETGAFVISRASVVTEKTRIGEKISIYEIPEGESLDVDSFFDLQCAQAMLNKHRAAIYVNGDGIGGMDRVDRALEIADGFYCKPDILYDANQTDAEVFGRTTHVLKPVGGTEGLFKICAKEQYDVFINDISSTSADYMIALRMVLPNAKIINFEDDGEGRRKADLVFNALDSKSDLPQVKVGHRFYIAGRVLKFCEPIRIGESVRRVLVCLDGANPRYASGRLLKMICKPEYQGFHFTLVIDRPEENAKAMIEYNRYDNIDVLCDAPNLSELMMNCDVGITSIGKTGYELCMLGIPTITMAQSCGEEKHGFICEENGFACISSDSDDETIEARLKAYLFMSQEGRRSLQDKLLSFDLRNGRTRVMRLIDSLFDEIS